jgi:hypothetical protein
VGYWPKDPEEPVITGPRLTIQTTPDEPPKPVYEIKWPKLNVKGITKGGDGKRFMAVLGDGIGLVEAGDKVKRVVGGVTYTWQITEINAKGIQQKRLDAIPPSD